jgi:NAD-dependent DNA ligase
MEINKLTREQLVPQYLIHSYLYYVEGRHFLSDRSYDILCVRLLSEWDEVEHPHKSLIDKEALSSGTGFYLKEEDYPLIVKTSSKHYHIED